MAQPGGPRLRVGFVAPRSRTLLVRAQRPGGLHGLARGPWSPAEKRGFLGRWAVSSQADGYARTAARVVENLQILAAKAARRVWNGGPDLFGEESVLEDLRSFFRTRQVPDLETTAQITLLTSSDAALQIPTGLVRSLDGEDGSDWILVEDAAPPTAPSPASEEWPSAPVTPGGEAWLRQHEAQLQLSAQASEELAVADGVAARAAAEVEPPPSGFVVSITKQVRRLHFVGSCYRIPGEHYRSFDKWGTFLPPAAEIGVVCKNCFRGGWAAAEALAAGEDSSGSSSTSSSSSESDASPAKRVKR